MSTLGVALRQRIPRALGPEDIRRCEVNAAGLDDLAFGSPGFDELVTEQHQDAIPSEERARSLPHGQETISEAPLQSICG